jgi:hypothetical protein
MGFLCLEGLPLIGREHPAQPKEHTGVRLFEFCAGLGDTVNLRQDLSLVRLISRQQGLHRRLFFVQAGA